MLVLNHFHLSKKLAPFAWACAILAMTASVQAADSPEGVAFFEQKVRPLLADHCYTCHSHTSEKLKGGLYLDYRDGWVKGGELGPVIVPGKPAESLLIKAVNYEDPELQMPPKKKLSADEIATLTKWVQMGAPDPRLQAPVAPPGSKKEVKIDIEAARRSLWSLQPLKVVDPATIPLKNAAWAKTSIDRFILQKLEEKHLSPNEAASKRILVRRAYFDLIGLPPAPAEVQAFIDDTSPNAYETLIDRLLASPAYGERWASYWLDVARFGESDGYEQDYDRPYAYHYRDFVIRALNQDLPFDTFVKWQLAGDEYEPENPMALAATGFLTAGTFPTQITEKEFESTRYNQLDDMTATTSVAFLGLSVGCARCHDHKFDPIPASDYYRMTATFTSAIRSDVNVDFTPDAEKDKLKKEFDAKRAILASKVEEFERDKLPALFAQYIQGLKKGGASVSKGWTTLNVQDASTKSGSTFTTLDDGSLLLKGKPAPTDAYTFNAQTRDVGMTAVQVEALTHESFPRRGPGLAPNGNFVLSDIHLTAAPLDGSATPIEVKLVSAKATHQQNNDILSVNASIDSDRISGWAVDMGGIGKDQAAIFQFEKPVGFAGGTKLTFTLLFNHPNRNHAIGRARLSTTTASDKIDFPNSQEPPESIAKTMTALAAGQTVEPKAGEDARRWYAGTLDEYKKLKASLAAFESAGSPRKQTKMQVTTEGLPPVKNHADERGYPHLYKDTYFLKRGDPNQKNGVATSSFLQVLMSPGMTEAHWQTPPPAGSRTTYRRRAMAEWMTDTRDGAGQLLARVIVNRLWQHHFGKGLVATPSDFGTRGAPPTHPELLDYLAGELIRDGWKLKQLQKRIMLSAAYAQSGAFDEARNAIDPENNFLWRRPIRRLESEAIRDALLSVSGELDPTMFGPGTRDASMRRRSIYFTIKRSALIPMMMVFDAPETLTPVAQRGSTTIAPQALLLMNNPHVREYATALVGRAAAEAGNGASREAVLAAAFRIAISREATALEIKEAIAFLDAQAATYAQAGKKNGAQIAMADFCQAILCMNEFVYVE